MSKKLRSIKFEVRKKPKKCIKNMHTLKNLTKICNFKLNQSEAYYDL
jgi:hypothetical protein